MGRFLEEIESNIWVAFLIYLTHYNTHNIFYLKIKNNLSSESVTGEDMHAASALHVALLIGLYTITEQDGP